MLIDWDKCQKGLTGEIIETLFKVAPYSLIISGWLLVFLASLVLGGGIAIAVHGLASMILGVFLYLVRELSNIQDRLNEEDLGGKKVK